MRVSIMPGHPMPDGFNHAVATIALAALRANGHELVFHDLYREGSDPVMPPADIATDAVLPPVTEQRRQWRRDMDNGIVRHVAPGA
jgi:putative NADPH-quinone reductase